MSATLAGPFAPHRADPGVVDELGDDLSRFGSRAESVGAQADRQGWLAGAVESQGLFDPIRSTVRPVLDGGVMLASASQVGRLALKVWSGAVRDYNRTIDRLNAEWATAKACNFGVGDLELDRSAMKPAQVDDAVTEHAAAVDRAKQALWADLVRRRDAAESRLDAVAEGVAGMLGHADDPDVQLLAAAAFAAPATEDASSGSCDVMAVPEMVCVSRETYASGDGQTWGEIADDLGEAFAFVFADPRECVGDDASAGGCGLEVAGILPIFKVPKWGVKLAKYFKRADKAKDHARDAKRAEWPKKRYDDLNSRGSTGRKKPSSLREEIAMEEVRENPEAGRILKRVQMSDPRWPRSDGWVKMSWYDRDLGIEIHYVMNTRTGGTDDFKFIER